MFVCKKGKVSLFNLTLFHYSRRDQSGADSVTSFWCRVWFGNIAWNWKVVFTTFFWLVRTLLQQNQTRLQKLSHNFWSRVWCCCAASVSTCAHCACLWIPETTAVDILSTHGAWCPLNALGKGIYRQFPWPVGCACGVTIPNPLAKIYCEAQARVRQGKARKGKGWWKVKGLKA